MINSTEETIFVKTQSVYLSHLIYAVFVADVLILLPLLLQWIIVKINSTTKFLTQNKNKKSIKFTQTNTILKYTYYKININKEEQF